MEWNAATIFAPAEQYVREPEGSEKPELRFNVGDNVECLTQEGWVPVRIADTWWLDGPGGAVYRMFTRDGVELYSTWDIPTSVRAVN